MVQSSLHQRLIEEDYRLVDRVFNESPVIHISYTDGGYLTLNKDGKTERLSNKPVTGFYIEEGRDVPEARPEGYDIEEFKTRFVVYVR